MRSKKIKLFNKKSKRHVMQKWIVPKADENGQWWWGYQKVYLHILPNQEQLKEEFVKRHTELKTK